MKRTQTAFFRRCLAALVCLCTTVCAAALPAGAQEPEYPYTYPAEQPYYEMSMYGFFKDASDEENDLVYTVGTFRLLDAQGGQSLAYCADAEIFDEPGFRYRPVALTELLRTSASADKLRAVISNSYPFISAEEMIGRMTAAGVGLNSDAIPNYEMVLISAAQQAVYSYTNPTYTIYKRFGGAVPKENYERYFKDLVYRFDSSYDNVQVTASLSLIEKDIDAVFGWLTGLAGQPAPAVTADASFTARLETAGDAYSLTLYNLSDDVKNGEDLAVTVTSGSETVYAAPAVVSDGVITASLRGDALSPGDTVSVTLTGGKPYSDVVAYESETKAAEPVRSQPLIGTGTLLAPFSAVRELTVPDKTSVRVTKVWSGDGVLPEAVTVHLLDTGADTGRTLTLNAANGWTGAFTGLDKTRGGAEIAYTVREDAVHGYASLVTGDAAGGFTITNTSNGVVTLRPADVTIYMGGDEGYRAVVAGGSDVLDANNSLPAPLFHIDAPDGVDPTELTFVSAEFIPGTQMPKSWTASVAGQTREGVTLYVLNKADAAQDDVRVRYSAGGSSVTNDQFDPNAVKDLYRDYTTTLYTGTQGAGSVHAAGPGGVTYGIRLGEGTLRVRAVELGSGTPETNPVFLMRGEAPSSRLAAGTAAVFAPEGTRYTLNHTTVAVEPDGVGLLFDDIYDSDNGQALRAGALIARSDETIGAAAANVTRRYEAKYLDLVDEDNGNAWVKTAGQTVTVVWAYPEGTDADTAFTLLHFAGLHRDDADEASSGYTVADIRAVDPEIMSIRKTDTGIAFDVPSGGFSPFVLIWETQKPAAQSAASVSTPQTGDAARPAVWVSLAAVSAAAAVTGGVVRRRR